MTSNTRLAGTRCTSQVSEAKRARGSTLNRRRAPSLSRQQETLVLFRVFSSYTRKEKPAQRELLQQDHQAVSSRLTSSSTTIMRKKTYLASGSYIDGLLVYQGSNLIMTTFPPHSTLPPDNANPSSSLMRLFTQYKALKNVTSHEDVLISSQSETRTNRPSSVAALKRH